MSSSNLPSMFISPSKRIARTVTRPSTSSPMTTSCPNKTKETGSETSAKTNCKARVCSFDLMDRKLSTSVFVSSAVFGTTKEAEVRQKNNIETTG